MYYHFIMDQILQQDLALFHHINQVWVHPVLDQFMSFMRNTYNWFPLYVFLISFLAFNFGKVGWYYVFFTISIVIFSNFLSSELIKKNVKRIRPCNEITLEGNRRILVHCGGGYSFTSSHATNHFCVSTFLFLTGINYIGRWRYLFLLWAAIISYAQVYVGVHYPMDVISGCLVGIFSGYIGSIIIKRLKLLA